MREAKAASEPGPGAGEEARSDAETEAEAETPANSKEAPGRHARHPRSLGKAPKQHLEPTSTMKHRFGDCKS